MDGAPAGSEGAKMLDQLRRVLLWLANRLEDQPLSTGADRCRVSVNRCRPVRTSDSRCRIAPAVASI